MSHLPSDFPKLPTSVGGQKLPNFLKAKVIGPVSTKPVPEKFKFDIKTSGVFGSTQGEVFDEGATWHPLQSVEFTFSDKGLASFRGCYQRRSTRLVGQPSKSHQNTVKLQKAEYIKGISGFRASDGVTDLTLHTSKRDVHVGPKHRNTTGTPFEFLVPADHQVIAFHGHSVATHVVGLGVMYQRRLESIGKKLHASDPVPTITASMSQQWLDADTQRAWSNNDMASIEQFKAKASTELDPIYQNIKAKGNDAWVEVESEGQKYHVSYTQNATIWAYTQDHPSANANSNTKDAIISIGSYSAGANFLGISTYTWTNLPTDIVSALVGLGFAILVRPLITAGVEFGIAYAAQLLAEGLAAAGVDAAAIMVPASVASAGGLIIAGVLGIAIALGVIALSSVLFREYWLVFNVYNFDKNHAWSSFSHYEDNSTVSNGEWKDETIGPFVTAGQNIAPPGFAPVKALNNVVTYLSMTFVNNSQFLQGLGEGIIMSRDDSALGVSAKYVVHRLKDNELGIYAIGHNPADYYLAGFYNNGPWVQANSTTSAFGDLTVYGSTPQLGGADDHVYTYEVNIGLPPAA